MRTSTEVPGFIQRTCLMTSANTPAPPSPRSSLVTEVITACLNPIRRTDSATRSGSPGSGGDGSPEGTAQNRQARVHLSPSIMKVACPLPQQSPRLGQREESHTVRESQWARVLLIFAERSGEETLVLSQDGLVGTSRESMC